MYKGALFVVGFVLMGLGLLAQNNRVVVKGTHRDLANVEISIFGYTDLLSSNSILLGTNLANEKGEFSIEFEIEETQQVTMPYGIYTGILYVEPGKEYDLILPDYREKTMAEILNPYFLSTEIYFGVKNSDESDINRLIAEFDDVNSAFIERHYYDLFKRPKQSTVDSLIRQFDDAYEGPDNPYLRTYMEYKYAWLRYVSYMREPNYMVREYYHNKPIAYRNVAYMDLFNQLYNNYFSFYMLKAEGARLFSDLARAKSPILIGETLENSMVLGNDTLRELVMLKGIHDAFYTDDFPFSSLLITLDSIAVSTTLPYHKYMAENIKSKVLQAKTGYPAPEFSMPNQGDTLMSNASFIGQYVYLNFVSVESFACQQDFELLKKLHEVHKEEFTIVSVSIDEDFNKAKAFFEQNNYEWTLLSAKELPDLVNDYKVKAYPMYYLIGPDGKLLMSPAMAPGENFEYYFFKGIKQKLRRN